MAILSEVKERSWATDKFGDRVLSWKWDWRDSRIMDWINNFVPIATKDSVGNIERLEAVKSGKMKRSLRWKTWAASGGDSQVFEARYIYYAKFVELAVGRGDPYNGPVPSIPGPNWLPIHVPTRRRKGKPHVVTEMRTQASKFTAMARSQFMFAGTVYMLYAMGGKDNPSIADAYNRAVWWALRQQRERRK